MPGIALSQRLPIRMARSQCPIDACLLAMCEEWLDMLPQGFAGISGSVLER